VNHLLEHRLGERPKLAEMQQLIREMPVIVATTSMLQSRPFIFALKHFSLCIVDEASQLLEPGIVGILTKNIDRFILIGDYKQLPAVVQQQESGDGARSLFERLLRQERQAGRTQFVGVLHKQGRMHPDVAAFTNEFFYRQEQITPVPLAHQQAEALDYDLPSEDTLDDLLKQERVAFFDSGMSGEYHEAAIVADLLRRIHRFYGDRFDSQKTVGVIVPYRIEIGRIRHEIQRLGIPELLDISIDTVERYQGSQRDVIIYDFAVSDNSQLQFITATCFEDNGCVIDRKLNVAMTRARKQLLMIGKAQVLQRNEIFAALIERYIKNYCTFAGRI
jgi:superfamily I DNA and/or RNA helicase